MAGSAGIYSQTPRGICCTGSPRLETARSQSVIWEPLCRPASRAKQQASPDNESRALERPHERHQVLLLLVGELGLQHDIEELDGVFEREQPPIVQVGGRVLNAAQNEGL